MVVNNMKTETLGEWAFLACVLIAVLAGLAATYASGVLGGQTGNIYALLVVLGIVVGLTTVTEKETTPFLVASVALLVAATVTGAAGFSAIPFIGALIGSIVSFIGVFVAPAAVIIAVKAVYALASKK